MQDEISISKDVLPSLDEEVFQETSIGDSRGAIKQYRSASGVHVREYSDRFVVHLDSFDPRTDPLAHLIVDSPESIFAFGTASFLSHNNIHFKSHFSPLSFLSLFLTFNHLFRFLKHLIFG
ncbi:MAG: hypothetical protein JRN67_10365 [Nitrososphaerota archaeon]|nr:hypothetical protein [Nitrososphaerota archaeon]